MIAVKKKRHWLWNILIFLTVMVCLLAFTAHYKNWIKIKEDHVRILSGVYYKELKFSDIDSVTMVERIPQMERINGFSAGTKEKGVFKDSLSNTKTYVYVDNLNHSKIRLVYQDSLKLFLNLSDSTKTYTMYEFLLDKIDSVQK
ncbi:MAG: hypothetical protein WBG90_21220 [Saonia sp.]